MVGKSNINLWSIKNSKRTLIGHHQECNGYGGDIRRKDV